jgi:hypothetical protein
MTTSPQQPRPIPAAVLVPLREHVDFLVRATDAYDAGFTSEITRCAVVLRALFHSPPPFLSWLARADGLQGGFLSTALPSNTEGVSKYGSLVITAHFDGRAIHLCALDSAWYARWVRFATWWDELVFVDEQKKELSRREVVLTVAAKDGGTNLDPNLALAYERLSQYESVDTTRNAAATEPVTIPERAALRQIAHETLRTLFPTYHKFQKPDADPRMNVARAKAFDPPASLPAPPPIRRHDPCPCGTGKKFKHCHGAI